MAYLTCIGGHGVAGRNLCGTGARGYWIFRRDKHVIVRFGAVTIRRRHSVRIEWVRWTEKRYRLQSRSRAADFLSTIVAEKTAPGHGYTKLKSGVRIHRRLYREG